MTNPEFNIGDTVTLDRYNHIDDVHIVKVTGYSEIGWGEDARLTYKMDVNGTTIESTGMSIMESKDYDPVPDEDRHERDPKKGLTAKELKIQWNKLNGH